MERKIVLKQDILDALKKVGVCKGQTIMVHTSLSSMGFVCGGAQIVIEALLESVGADGTVEIPAVSAVILVKGEADTTPIESSTSDTEKLDGNKRANPGLIIALGAVIVVAVAIVIALVIKRKQ